MTTTLLPPPFANLAPFAEKWARPTENERSALRWGSNAVEFTAFYDGLIDRLEDILAYLAQYSSDDLPEEARNLYYLACAFAETTPHHELYGGSPVVPFSFDARRFVRFGGDKPN